MVLPPFPLASHFHVFLSNKSHICDYYEHSLCAMMVHICVSRQARDRPRLQWPFRGQTAAPVNVARQSHGTLTEADLLLFIRLSIPYLSVHLGFTSFYSLTISDSLSIHLTFCLFLFHSSLPDDDVVAYLFFLFVCMKDRYINSEGHSLMDGSAFAQSPAIKITR